MFIFFFYNTIFLFYFNKLKNCIVEEFLRDLLNFQNLICDHNTLNIKNKLIITICLFFSAKALSPNI